MVRTSHIDINGLSRPVVHQIIQAMSVLDCLQERYPTAVIAGGAPRDWMYNQPARDIDIFIYEPEVFVDYNAFMVTMANRIQEITGMHVVPKQDIHYAIDMTNEQGLMFVFEGYIFPNTYQIMVHNREVRDVYKRFPTSLSRYWVTHPILTGILQIHRSQLADLGRKYKKIFCREGAPFTEQQKNYLMKIWAKVPDYAVVGDSEGYAYAEREGEVNEELRDLD